MPSTASPPPSSAWLQHVVTAGDLTGDATPHRPLQWVQVAAHAFPELTTVSKAKRARKAGHLLLNGQPRVATLTCAAVGDVLTYFSPERQQQLLPTAVVEASRLQSWLKTCRTQGLRLVFESDSAAAVVKPVGIHVKGRGPRTVERALPLLLQRPQCVEFGDAELPVPHAVHRLDYRVGGLLLVAKSRRMEVELSAQLESHSVTKQYRAILVGDVREKVARNGGGVDSVQLPKALQEIRDELQFLADPLDGRPCLTAMRVVSTTRSARYEWISTVDLWPLTGRKHQLRLHTARCGHPIVGDDLYHDTSNNTGNDEEEDGGSGSEQHHAPVVRGMGLFLFSVAVAFNDAVGNRRSFHIDEPNKFARFRHFSDLNWRKKALRDRANTKDSV